MAKDQKKIGIIKATPISPPIRDLLKVRHGDRDLIVSYPAFGPDIYSRNLSEMQRTYTHSDEFSSFSFREPTTSESISAWAYKFKKKSELPGTLQLGRIVRTSEGVFANPPKDENGKPVVDERILKRFLNGVKENWVYIPSAIDEKILKRILHISNSNDELYRSYYMNKLLRDHPPEKQVYVFNYIVPDGIKTVEGFDYNLKDFGFAPYESFSIGEQSFFKFFEGGLAGILEHTNGRAVNLRDIYTSTSSPFFNVGLYGVNRIENKSRGIYGFPISVNPEDVKEPILLVVELYHSSSGWSLYCSDRKTGYAFGVLGTPAKISEQKI